MARRKDAIYHTGSIFPFVSVLFCTIGALALLWAAGSLDAIADDPQLPAEIAEAEAEVAQLQQAMEDRLAELRRLDAVAETAQLRLDQLQQQLEDANEEEVALRLQVDALRRQREELLEQSTQVRELLASVQGNEQILSEFQDRVRLLNEIGVAEQRLQQRQDDLESLRSQEREAEAVLARLRQQLARLHERQSLLAQSVHQADLTLLGDDTLQALWIEVDAQGFRVLGAASQQHFERSAFLIDGGPLAQHIPMMIDGTVHPIFLVRPRAHEMYHAAARWMREQRLDFSSEPVDAHWDLAAIGNGGVP